MSTLVPVPVAPPAHRAVARGRSPVLSRPPQPAAARAATRRRQRALAARPVASQRRPATGHAVLRRVSARARRDGERDLGPDPRPAARCGTARPAVRGSAAALAPERCAAPRYAVGAGRRRKPSTPGTSARLSALPMRRVRPASCSPTPPCPGDTPEGVRGQPRNGAQVAGARVLRGWRRQAGPDRGRVHGVRRRSGLGSISIRTGGCSCGHAAELLQRLPPIQPISAMQGRRSLLDRSNADNVTVA